MIYDHGIFLISLQTLMYLALVAAIILLNCIWFHFLLYLINVNLFSIFFLIQFLRGNTEYGGLLYLVGLLYINKSFVCMFEIAIFVCWQKMHTLTVFSCNHIIYLLVYYCMIYTAYFACVPRVYIFVHLHISIANDAPRQNS